jgi:FtsP/CotA-like multicopper oxidase with cupredoxin domain
MNRRDLLRFGLAAGSAGLAAKAFDKGSSGTSGSGGSGSGGSGSTLVSSSGLISPPVRPWIEPLFIPGVAQPSVLTPAFQPNEPARDWWAPYTHQRYSEFPAKKCYEIKVQNVNWSFHRDLPAAAMFGYGGTVPGPMIQAKYGEPIIVRINNMLQKISYGVGVPETATHLHNMHSPSESDGFPGDFVTSGNYRDNHYPMIRAGYNASPSTNGDYRESLGTLWYHDHRFNFTSHNVYKGLFGFFNAFDELDTGNETDPSSTALRLPSGQFDIQLGFQDPQFDNTGQIFFNVFDTDGHLGDKIAVNGKVQPYLDVQRRKYRFRLLDGGPSRWYQIYLSKGLPAANTTSWLPMTLIANDGNLLEAPVTVDHVQLAVANRMDVVIDFSKFNDGDELYLVNRAEQTSGRGPTGNIMNPGVPILKFKVHGVVPAPDPSVVPAKLRPLPRPSAAELSSAVQRTFNFNRANGGWTVNGVLADITQVTAAPKQGSAEIWTIINSSGSWSHPVHIHFEEFQILDRNGVAPQPFEVSRKDVLNLGPNESVRCFFRFRDLLGRYVMHCHNVVHEDHAMMIRWDIVK